MNKVITYGTYDLLHQGHINLLKNAKALGDYLIVGVTSDSYDRGRGKLNVRKNVLERIELVKQTGLADEIIIEDYVGQKIDDIRRFGVSVFTVGSDWEGHFDYLEEFCKVKYLPRTSGVSSTQLRNDTQMNYRLGVIGTGRIARRFMPEVNFVAGVEVTSVLNPDPSQIKDFEKLHSNPILFTDFDKFIDSVDLVYIASPHLTHYDYAKKSLIAKKHVLCEIPFVLSSSEAKELYGLANKNKMVLMEASKTAFFPGFNRLVTLVKSGVIGEVVDIDSSLSKLIVDKYSRELDESQAGGSVTELASYPLLSIIKILGCEIKDVKFYSKLKGGVDIYTKGVILYDKAVATIKLGLGIKTEGSLVISGTEGYVYVPAPWWKTDYFEIRFEDQNKNKKFFYGYEGEGLRYELQEFVSCINDKRSSSFKLSMKESILISDVIEMYRKGDKVTIIN